LAQGPRRKCNRLASPAVPPDERDGLREEDVVDKDIVPTVALFVPLLLVPIFSFVAVLVWVDTRRREREALYRSETIKRISETQGAGSVVEFLHEEEKITARRNREGQRLGGLVTAGVGVAIMVMLAGLDPREPAYLAGLIPLVVGAALLVYSYLLAPKA
jgi:hypothetical protein